MFLNQLPVFSPCIPQIIIFQTLRRVMSSVGSNVPSASCCPNRAWPLWPLLPCLHSPQLCLKDSDPVTHCLCAEHTWGDGEGLGGFQSETSAGNTSSNLPNGCSPCSLTEKTAWQSRALLLPPSRWMQAGSMLPCTGSHSSTCRWFHFTHSCSSDFF